MAWEDVIVPGWMAGLSWRRKEVCPNQREKSLRKQRGRKSLVCPQVPKETAHESAGDRVEREIGKWGFMLFHRT